SRSNCALIGEEASHDVGKQLDQHISMVSNEPESISKKLEGQCKQARRRLGNQQEGISHALDDRANTRPNSGQAGEVDIHLRKRVEEPAQRGEIQRLNLLPEVSNPESSLLHEAHKTRAGNFAVIGFPGGTAGLATAGNLIPHTAHADCSRLANAQPATHRHDAIAGLPLIDKDLKASRNAEEEVRQRLYIEVLDPTSK